MYMYPSYNPYRPRYGFGYPYGYGYGYGYPYGYGSSYNILNSQLANVNQSMYNYGYMNGVSQSSIVNNSGFWPGY